MLENLLQILRLHIDLKIRCDLEHVSMVKGLSILKLNTDLK